MAIRRLFGHGWSRRQRRTRHINFQLPEPVTQCTPKIVYETPLRRVAPIVVFSLVRRS